ncbi:MAG: hypothetical protein QOG58_5966 [Caballeronia sp.]|jgi:hypothetical protein|nr:hypothetical protein [Caballeronia sp.]
MWALLQHMTILCWLFRNTELVGPESKRIGEDVAIPDSDVRLLTTIERR